MSSDRTSTERRGEISAPAYRWIFAAIVAAGALVRLAYVRGVKWDDEVVGDELHYFAQAATIARGDWFQDPWFEGYSALHAPLTALLLAPVSWVDQNLIVSQRLLMAGYGTIAVVALGLLARYLFDRLISLAVTAVAAIYANLWINDGILMSETPAALATVGVLFAVYWYERVRSPWAAAGLGATIGLAGLARSELLMLGVLVVLPLVLSERSRPIIGRLGHLGLAALAAVALVSPWVIRNQVRFEEPTFMSTQDGLTLLGANCPETYHGPGLGFWNIGCAERVAVPEGADESVRSKLYRDAAFDYALDNVDRIPVVVLARLGRGLSAWDVDTMFDWNQAEGRHVWVSRLGFWQYWLLLPVAGIGLWRWPTRAPRWPLLATASVSVLVIAVFYGIPRFRVPAEVGIVLCAGVGLVEAWRWLAGRRAAGRERPDRRGAECPPSPA